MNTEQQDAKKAFELDEGYPSFSDKLVLSIIKTVSSMKKTVNVNEIEDFGNKFIVRAGSTGTDLYKESDKGIVENLGYITLKMIGSPEKKVRFSVWERIKSSKILR